MNIIHATVLISIKHYEMLCKLLCKIVTDQKKLFIVSVILEHFRLTDYRWFYCIDHRKVSVSVK